MEANHGRSQRLTALMWLSWTVPLLLTQAFLQSSRVIAQARPAAAALIGD